MVQALTISFTVTRKFLRLSDITICLNVGWGDALPLIAQYELTPPVSLLCVRTPPYSFSPSWYSSLDGLNVCMSETFRELMHLNVRHLVEEPGVLHKNDLLSLWCVDCPLSEGISDDAKVILLKLEDREKVCNLALVNSHFKHSEVIFHRGRRDAYTAVHTEKFHCGPDMC